MLISMDDLKIKHGVNLRGRRIIHAGAHLAEEAKDYHRCGVRRVLWIEGNPALMSNLHRNLRPYQGQDAVCAMVGAASGAEVEFHVANVSMSSSVLELGTHKEKHPDVSYVGTQTAVLHTIDEVAEEADMIGAEMLELDLQGYELPALQGATRVLSEAKWVYLEVNMDELYEGCALFSEVEPFLRSLGFEFKEVSLAGCQRRNCSDGGNRWVGWGDGFAEKTDNPLPFSESHPFEWADWTT